MNEGTTGVIKERLDKSKNVLIASHVRPDGDAIGSLLGLGLALLDAGKSVQMVLVDGMPPLLNIWKEAAEYLKNQPENMIRLSPSILQISNEWEKPSKILGSLIS